MAVFDIDMTLLNNQQRYTDAKRAGVVDKDGKAKRKTRFETPGKAFKRAQDFLFDASRLEKDRLIAGAADFVNQLVEDGYIVAYCTGRRLTYYEVTRAQLERKGFPIMKDDQDRELLFMRAGGSKTTPEYKKDVLSALNAAYDVRFFFDDLPENLAAAAQVGIPGLYLSISDYSKMLTKSNPSASEFFPGDTTVAPHYMTAQTIPITSLQNPPVKPRRKKMKNGKYRKEPAKKYIDRFMGDSKMNKEFPDRGQRYAVSLQYVDKFYGKRGLDSVGARRNPEEYSEDYMVPRDIHRLGKAADRLEDTYEDGQEVPEWWKSKMSVTARDADTLSDALDYVAQNPSDCPPATQSLELNTKNRNNAIQSDYIRYGPLNLNDLRYYDDAAAHWNTDVATAKKSKCSNCVAFDTSPRMLDCMPGPVSQPIEDEEGYLGYCWMHHFKCHSARTCYTWAAGGPITENKVSMEWQDRAFSKTNPPNILPIYAGEPTSKFSNKGMVSAEVQIGRNLFKDIGEAVQSIYRGLIGGRTSMAERRMAMAMASMQKELSERAAAKGANAVANLKVDYEMVDQSVTMTLIATADAIKMTRPPKQNPLPLMGLSVQVSGYRNAAGAFVMKGKKFLILQRSTKETSMHGLWELPGGKVEEGETPRQTAVIEVKEEAGLDIKLKSNLGPHHDDKKKKTYHAYIATAKKGQKVKLSEEHSAHKWVTPEEVMAMPKEMVSHHLLYFLKKEGETIRSNPRKNPSDSKKIEKGKKLYEHMNGKAPEKVEKKQIDMGDVWYQVGEGGCWQIGYMSGKETGNPNQKYTHTFNEETQDGNFPKLYATMPENGKPLLIIQGGTWKIRTDDKGVAWIYD